MENVQKVPYLFGNRKGLLSQTCSMEAHLRNQYPSTIQRTLGEHFVYFSHKGIQEMLLHMKEEETKIKFGQLMYLHFIAKE